MIKILLFSIKKSRILSKIRLESEQKINPHDIYNTVVSNLVAGKTMTRRDIYFEELLALLKTDLATTNLLKKYGRNFDDIRKIVKLLEVTGAGQIKGGHYVAISSIAFLRQLNAIIENWDGENFSIQNLDSRNSNLKMADYLVSSFK